MAEDAGMKGTKALYSALLAKDEVPLSFVDSLGEAGGCFVEMVRTQKLPYRIIWARAGGELASIAAAPAFAAAITNTMANIPYEKLKRQLCDAFIEPNLERFDEILSYAKSFDTPEMREERHQLPHKEQAKLLTDQLLDQFGLKFTGSILGQFLTQDYFLRKFNAPVNRKVNAFSVILDRGVQIGSMVIANTVASDQAIATQNALSKILQNVGMNEADAKEWANYHINFSVPNLVAAVVSTSVLIHSAARR